MDGFLLHPRLAADTAFVADLELSRLLVMRDQRFAWAVLVPRRPLACELHALSPEDRALLLEEAAWVADRLSAWPGVTKINHGALGNLVPQLHWHVVGRSPQDPAWPGPVWGSGPAVGPEPEWLDSLVTHLRPA